MTRYGWPLLQGIRLSGEKIIQAIHTHIGCVYIWVCVLSFVRQRQTTHNLSLRCKAFYRIQSSFELGLWSYSELKWLRFGSDNPSHYVCRSVGVCVFKHAKQKRTENRERQVWLCCCTTVCESIHDHNAERENAIRGHRLTVWLQRLNAHIYAETSSKLQWCRGLLFSTVKHQTLDYSGKHL